MGDAVLEIVSSEFLFINYPQKPEGELTKLRASIVCEPTLALCTKPLDLGKYLRLGRGEDQMCIRDRNVLNMFAHTKSNKEFVNLVKKNRIL